MEFKERVIQLTDRASRLSGIIYRSAAPKYANSKDLLTGDGSRKFGGRWNPPGLTAVYGSFTPQTALEEALAHSRYFGLPIHASMPRTFAAVEFNLRSVLDFTDGAIRRSLAVSEKRLMSCDWRTDMRAGGTPITQKLGAAASQVGLEAIVVRSVADRRGRNLVVFPENLMRS